MRNSIIFVLFLTVLMSACGSKSEQQESKVEDVFAEPDSMVYGLACDGSNDSVIVILPFGHDKDPVTYHIEVASQQHQVIGQPSIGDWVGIIINPEDTTEASMVINLDQLKGTWTYQVRPTWKDASKMSARALRRKMAEIPDSLREAYMVPREYGFTLKRSSVASAVGRIMRSNSLEDDSPVEYPPVKNYIRWKCHNGVLYMTSTDKPFLPINKEEGSKEEAQYKEVRDTFFFVSMTCDSLILRNTKNEVIHFHRQANAHTANAAAQKAMQTTDNKEKTVK